MPREHVIAIDPSKPLAEEPKTGHNRWHEAIEPVLEVDPGDTVVYETRDAFDGQLNRGSSAADVEQLDLNVVHPLTGPVFVKGAQEGDLLEVELVAIEADPWEQWGYTIEVPGFGFLREEFPDPFIVHWRLHGNEYAESEQLPGVRIRCNPHPGTLGLAPAPGCASGPPSERRNLQSGTGLPCHPSRRAPSRTTSRSPGRRCGPSRRVRRPET